MENEGKFFPLNLLPEATTREGTPGDFYDEEST